MCISIVQCEIPCAFIPVGVSGQVFSFESSSRHMPAAVSNYRRWRANWELTHASTWPDNVLFTQASAAEAVDHMTSAVDAVSGHPGHRGLINLLKGGVCPLREFLLKVG